MRIELASPAVPVTLAPMSMLLLPVVMGGPRPFVFVPSPLSRVSDHPSFAARVPEGRDQPAVALFQISDFWPSIMLRDTHSAFSVSTLEFPLAREL